MLLSSVASNATRVPIARGIDDLDHRQHHRHFDQHADHRRQCGSGIESEKADGCRHRQFEEIGGADQCRRTGDIVLLSHRPVEPVRERGIEKHLNQDRNCQHRDNQGLVEYGLSLESEQQDQRQQQSAD